MAQPLFRIFKLGIETKDLAAFRKVGQTNLLTSLANEEGTWAMYACHEDEQGLANVVCELYQAEPAYQVHANSAHFQAFASLAKRAVKKRKVLNLKPELLLKKPGQLKVSGANNLEIRLAQIVIATDKLPAFRQSVFSEMQTAIKKEPGVLAMYAGSLPQENQWYFFEVYQDVSSYETHRQTAHFKRYLEETTPLVVSKQLTRLVTDTAISQALEINLQVN